MMDQRVILGIDPGTNILGFGVILVQNRSVQYVDMGYMDFRKEDDHFEKLKQIFSNVTFLIGKYRPTELAIEAPFYGKNPQVMLKLGRAQGAAIAAALHAGLPVYEYAPRKIKMAITGNGASSKEQVAMMLEKTFKLSFNARYLDSTDAMAVAMCHFYQLSNPQSDSAASTSWEAFIKSHPKRIR